MRTIDSLIMKGMSMNHQVWMRHANPWSGWTRIAGFPVLFLAIWSYVWIGWWSLLPVGLFMVWTWFNPRLFPRVQSDRNWITKGVFGEMIWVERHKRPIPSHHDKAASFAISCSLVALGVAIYGFIVQDFWAAFMGWNMAVLAKVWYVDRMVWLYEDLKHRDPRFAEFQAR